MAIECPNCGSEYFSWIVEQTEIGTVLEGPADGLPRINFESRGELVKIRSDSVTCGECHHPWSMTELQEHIESDDQNGLEQ